MALTETTKEAMWLRSLLQELGFNNNEPIIINGDNQSSLALAQNPLFHSRTKHIDIRWHFVREKQKTGEIQLQFCSTDNMAADIFTKALTKERHIKLVGLMGIKEVKVSQSGSIGSDAAQPFRRCTHNM